MTSSIVLSSIIVQAIISLYLFNTLKSKDDFEKTLGIMFIILIFHLGTKFFILTVLKDHLLYTNNATGFGMSYGPLLFIMARSFVKKPLARQSVLIHMLPFVIFTLLYFINEGLYFLKVIPSGFIKQYSPFYQWLTLASLVIYPLTTNQLLDKYSPARAEPAESRAHILRAMTYVMFLGTTLGLLIALVHIVRTGNTDFDLRLVPYLCLSILPALILRYKIRAAVSKTHIQEPTIVDAEQRDEREQHYKKSALDAQMIDQYEVTLKKFMDKSKVYLETEISLETLSARVKIPKHHLTQLLNERLKKNFYAFINEYRIKEAIRRLENAKADENILSLAYDCGFNSKSSFNNYFKKITGLTPSMYRKLYGVSEKKLVS
jgi:AraC-like DNA-binding protein